MDSSTALTTSNTTIYSDSGGDLAGVVDSDNVRVCPLTINFGHEGFKDGVDCVKREPYACMQGLSLA